MIGRLVTVLLAFASVVTALHRAHHSLRKGEVNLLHFLENDAAADEQKAGLLANFRKDLQRLSTLYTSLDAKLKSGQSATNERLAQFQADLASRQQELATLQSGYTKLQSLKQAACGRLQEAADLIAQGREEKLQLLATPGSQSKNNDWYVPLRNQADRKIAYGEFLITECTEKTADLDEYTPSYAAQYRSLSAKITQLGLQINSETQQSTSTQLQQKDVTAVIAGLTAIAQTGISEVQVAVKDITPVQSSKTYGHAIVDEFVRKFVADAVEFKTSLQNRLSALLSKTDSLEQAYETAESAFAAKQKEVNDLYAQCSRLLGIVKKSDLPTTAAQTARVKGEIDAWAKQNFGGVSPVRSLQVSIFGTEASCVLKLASYHKKRSTSQYVVSADLGGKHFYLGGGKIWKIMLVDHSKADSTDVHDKTYFGQWIVSRQRTQACLARYDADIQKADNDYRLDMEARQQESDRLKTEVLPGLNSQLDTLRTAALKAKGDLDSLKNAIEGLEESLEEIFFS